MLKQNQIHISPNKITKVNIKSRLIQYKFFNKCLDQQPTLLYMRVFW